MMLYQKLKIKFNRESIYYFLSKYYLEIIFIFSFLPFYILCFYNLPVGDDFMYGEVGNKMYIKEALTYWFNNWSGRYTQIFFSTVILPLSYGSWHYFWFIPLILITTLLMCLYFLIKETTKSFLTKNEIYTSFILISIVVINLMPEIGETLYWSSGALTYQLGNIFFLIFFTFLIKLFKVKSSKKELLYLFISIILAFLAIGCNEITLVYSILSSICFTILYYINFKKINISYTIISLSTIFFGIFSISAKGNQIRATQLGTNDLELTRFMLSVFESFFRFLFYSFNWLPMLIVISLILLPQLKKAQEYLLIYKRNTFFLITFSFIFISAGFFPSIYKTGWNAPRAVAPIFIVFVLCFFYTLIFVNKKCFETLLPWHNLLIKNKLLIFIFLIGFFNNHNIMNAYKDLTSLKAHKYHIEIKKLYTELEFSKNDTIYTRPFSHKPLTLPYRSPQPYNFLVNEELEKYFNKKIQIENFNYEE